jgi:Carboxypeptidase regulatory-like domain
VLLGTSAGSLEGDVLGSDQKPVAAMTIVLVPPDNRRQNAALYKTGRSNEQGHFTLPNVPPGRYTLYAWDSVPVGAYQNAQFMERYSTRGISVNIQAGTRTTANVSVIRE